MGIIKDYIQRMRERKQRTEGYAEDQHTVENFHAKKMSSDERELNRYREEERERRIKSQVKALRKKENDAVWSGRQGNPIDAPNVIANHKNLFNGKNMFAHNENGYSQPNVVKCKNIFHVGKCKK